MQDDPSFWTKRRASATIPAPTEALGQERDTLTKRVTMPACETLDRPLSPRFNEALGYAATLHREQARKQTQIPYISHLLAVASIVLENGGTEDQAIAALLHDAIEDQGADKGEEIRAKFGEAVYAIVQGCTDAEVSKGDAKPPWRQRKETYIVHVRKAPPSVRLVSAADKLHNARAILADYRDLGESLWGRFNGKKDGTLWYYRELAKAFRHGEQTDGLRRIVDELERVVLELETLSQVIP
jgi:(p)ppGpp synthase/HD superfamily hydrolase